MEEILHFYIKIIIITLIYSEKGQTVRRGNMATGDSVISMRNFDDIVIDKPDDFVSKEYLYDELIKAIRRYHPSDDISMIEKAYELADKAHKDQKRKSGEPYIIHPLCCENIGGSGT